MALTIITSNPVGLATKDTSIVTGVAVTGDTQEQLLSVGVCWSTNPGPVVESDSFLETGSSLGSYVAEITGLVPNTTYYIVGYVETDTDVYYGDELTVITKLLATPEYTDKVFIKYSPLVPFNKDFVVAQTYIESNEEIAPLTPSTGKVTSESYPVAGSGTAYRLIGDGIHTPTFSPLFLKTASSGSYDNSLNILNLVSFIYDGIDFWYAITQAVEVFAPRTLTVEDIDRVSIVLTFDRVLNENSVPDIFSFDVPGNIVGSVTIAGAVVTIGVTTPFTHSDTITISYTEPELNPIIKAEGVGKAASFTNKSVVNNIVAL